MVARIVEGHGGRVWAEAAPGAGATADVEALERAKVIDRHVDMSPEAVERRLAAMGQLYRLGLSLRKARRLGPVEPAGAGPSASARGSARSEEGRSAGFPPSPGDEAT